MIECLTNEFEEDGSADLWNFMRRVVAEVFDQNVFRMATTLSNDILSVALCAREVLDLGLPPTLDARACLAAVRSLPALEWPSDLKNLHTEIDAIMMELKGEELEVVSGGTVAGAATGDDVGRRTSEVESLASVASEVLGAQGGLPGSTSCQPEFGEALPEVWDPLQEVLPELNAAEAAAALRAHGGSVREALAALLQPGAGAQGAQLSKL